MSQTSNNILLFRRQWSSARFSLQTLLLDFCLDYLDVSLWHLVASLRHAVCLVLDLIGNLPQNLNEGRQLVLLGLASRFNSEDRRVVFYVLEGLHHEVLSLENEALSELLDGMVVGIGIFDQFDVVTGPDGSLLLNFLALDLEAHLLTVGVGIIFADFTEHIGLADSSGQECLLQVEGLDFEAGGHVELRVQLVGDQEVFAGQTCWEGLANEGKHLFEGVVDLHFEAFLCVFDNSKLRVADPSFDQFAVNFACLLQAHSLLFLVSL